jgi:NDP-sugar pyrophosphorylase family protein
MAQAGVKGMKDLPENEPFIAINARIIPNRNFLKYFDVLIEKKSKLAADDNGNLLTGIFSSKEEFVESVKKGVKTNVKPMLEVIRYPWDLVNTIGEWIKNDSIFMQDRDCWVKPKLPNVIIENKDNVYIHKTAKLSAGTVIDSTGGPVVIDEGAEIMYNSVIIGPAYIGKNSKIKIGAKIYQNTTDRRNLQGRWRSRRLHNPRVQQ